MYNALLNLGNLDHPSGKIVKTILSIGSLINCLAKLHVPWKELPPTAYMYIAYPYLPYTTQPLHPVHTQKEGADDEDSEGSDVYAPSDGSDDIGEESGSEDSDEDYTSIDEDEDESGEGGRFC